MGVVGESGAYAGAGMLQRPGTITHLPDHDCWYGHDSISLL